MKLELFGIYDVKLDAYRDFFPAETLGHGLRVFGDLVSNPQGSYYKHAEDFSLAHLGTIDRANGMVTPVKQPTILELAVDASADHKRYYASLSIGQNPNIDMQGEPVKLAS